jgi:type VI secretion system lysozyme-like protein
LSNINLLKRLTTLNQAKQPLSVALSIKETLLNILNTRENSVPARPDMGTPDFRGMEIFTKHPLQDLQEKILYQIRQFEPRLQQVTVVCSAIEGDIAQLFHCSINAQIKTSPSQKFALNLNCLANGRIVST